jgi:hypothetical protein
MHIQINQIKMRVKLINLMNYVCGGIIPKIIDLNDNYIIIPIEIFQIYNNLVFQQNICNMLIKPLELDNINNITSYIKNDEEKTKTIIDKTMIEALKEYSKIENFVEEEGDKEIIEELYISPKRGSFSGEKNSWSFHRSSNNFIITVNIISDDDFLKKCKSGNIRPFEKDMLKVKLKTIFNLETKKAKKVEILKVLDYIKYENKEQNLIDKN